MRKAGPILILLIGVLALAIDFLPGLQLPDSTSADGSWRPIVTKLGLDLEGGLRVEYQALPVDGQGRPPGDMAVIKDIIERRVNTTGVSEPVVTTQGTDRVVVELPGVTDPEAIRQLVGQTGRLDFVPLGSTQATTNQVLDPKQYPPLFSGDQVASATVGTDQNGRPAVDFVLKDDGKNKFADYTAKNVGAYFAITLDDAVISAPVIQNSIPGGNVQITGGGHRRLQRQGRDRARHRPQVRLAAVPDPGAVERDDQRDARRAVPEPDPPRRPARHLAGARLHAHLLPAAGRGGQLRAHLLHARDVRDLPAHPGDLTLAGIAGFVLSVGMAVDANILIFERMKEELRLGKSLPAAVEAGFNRAWNSILDSNVSSLITATILYAFGSSVIRGFALVLIIGVLVSMFSAIVVTRTILRWVVRQEWARKPSLCGLRDDEFVALGAVRPSARREARGRV